MSIKFDPTDEQNKALKAFDTGGDMVLEAGAGTGKTSTLRLLADSEPDLRGIYIAYNRAIAQDAKDSFPHNTHAATMHSFAYKSVGLKYKERLNGPRVTNKQIAYILGINNPFSLGEGRRLHQNKIARLVMETVQRFCYSSDEDPDTHHVPLMPGTELVREELSGYVASLAQRAWGDIRKTNGNLRFQHDHYLKLYALSEPTIKCDFLLLDEAQDANPVIMQIVEMQSAHAQIVLVGDAAQQIYAWRGAVDAMTDFNADHRVLLSQSFRFGQAIADEANKWLTILDSDLRLKGFEKINSKVEPVSEPKCVLCRTNAEAVAQALRAKEENKRAALVGGTDQIRSFAEGARELQQTGNTWHPELQAFKSWDDVREYIEEEGGADLKVFVNLVDTYGIEKVLEIIDDMVEERYADIILSTAHKAKGREWESVRIASDFREPDEIDDINTGEFNLAYVAVTRAKEQLDNEGLDWINHHV